MCVCVCVCMCVYVCMYVCIYIYNTKSFFPYAMWDIIITLYESIIIKHIPIVKQG